MRSTRLRSAFSAPLLRLSLLLILLGTSLGPTHAWAGPAEDVARAVKEKKEHRVLEILIAHPTEAAFIEALQWPRQTSSSAYEIKKLLEPWVARSAKLRATIVAELKKGKYDWGISLIAPVLATEPTAHALVRAAAAQGEPDALEALAPFLKTNRDDLDTVMARARKDVGKHYSSAMYALRNHVREIPSVRAFFLSELSRSNSPNWLLILLQTASADIVRDPELLQATRNILTRIDDEAALEVKALVLKVLLNHNPSDTEAVETFAKMLRKSFLEPQPDAPRGAFHALRRYIGQNAALDRAIDQSMKDLVEAVEMPWLFMTGGTSDFNAIALWIKIDKSPFSYDSFFKHYLRLHQNDRSFDVKLVRKYLDFAPHDLKYTAYIHLVTQSDQLPREAESLVKEAISKVHISDAADNLPDKQMPSSALIEVARKILKDGNNWDVGGAAEVLLRAAKIDPRYLDEVRQAVGVSRGVTKDRLIATLRDYDSSLPEVRIKTSTLPAQQRRTLLTDPTPPAGWRQVVQANAVGYHINHDPFLLKDGVDEIWAQKAEQGRGIRAARMQEAERAFGKKGLVSRPIAWAKKQLNDRLKKVKNHDQQQPKLTAVQRAQLQSAAMAKYPGKTIDQVLQSDQKADYLRDLNAMELTTAGAPPKSLKTQDQLITEAWRKSTLEELQDVFRKGMRAIINSGQGKLLAHSPRDTHFTSAILIREQDLDEIRVIAQRKSPPYTSTVEWGGKLYEIKFMGRGLEGAGIDLMTSSRNGAHEIAALTLGPKRSAEELAQETYLARTFDAWMNGLRETRTILEEEAPNRLASELRTMAAHEPFKIAVAIHPGGPEEALMDALWQPLEKDSTHWAQREISGLDQGKHWQIDLARGPALEFSEGEMPALKKANVEIGEARNGALPSITRKAAPSNPDLSDDLAAQRDLYYRIDPKKEKLKRIPQRFVTAPIEDFDSTRSMPVLKAIPFEDAKAEFSLLSDQSLRVQAGLVSIPIPTTETHEYDVRALQVFDGRGTRLYPGRDYVVLRGTSNRGLGIRILKSGVTDVRFSASFSKGAKLKYPKLPTLDEARVRTAIGHLQQAGFRRVARGLRSLVYDPKRKKPVSLEAASEVFRAEARYFTGAEKGLGQVETSRSNPFHDLAQFIDEDGRICTKCLGTNVLFDRFLGIALNPSAGVTVDQVTLWTRNPSSVLITGYNLHSETGLTFAGIPTPLRIDVTPSATRAYHVAMEAERPLDHGKPEWVSQIKDQPAEPFLEPVTHAPASVSLVEEENLYQGRQNAGTVIRERKLALRERIKALQKKGTVPRTTSLDRTEPLIRSQMLAEIAEHALSGNHKSGDELATKLKRLSPWFEGRPLENLAQIHKAIADFAREERLRLDTFVRESQARHRFPHYLEPDLQEDLRLLYRGLEDLKDPSHLSGSCVVKGLEAVKH